MREKLIDEIAQCLCGNYKDACIDCVSFGVCTFTCYAELIYDKGYRKQSEGEWKQTTEPLGAHYVDCVECSACGESWVLDEYFDYDVAKDFWNFCPNCGAKMKGGE